MHHTNNAVIMQTEQLGQIKTLEEKLHSAEGYIQDLEHKLVKQDHVLAQLMGDNLDHLQDNMRLTAYIDSSSKRMRQLKKANEAARDTSQAVGVGFDGDGQGSDGGEGPVLVGSRDVGCFWQQSG